MNPSARLIVLGCLLLTAPSFAADPPSLRYEIRNEGDGLEISATGPEVANGTFFVALGSPGTGGSAILPFERSAEGSTVFLPFKASALIMAAADGTSIRRWMGTKWGERMPAGDSVQITRGEGSLKLKADGALAGPAGTREVAVYFKDFRGNPWGRLFGATGPNDPSGEGDLALRGYFAEAGGSYAARTRAGSAVSKVRIYQFLPRLFGNTNETRKPNGFIEENGSGKFADLSAPVLESLKQMGFTHVWPTGVLQQATATDYASVGESADDPDLLKGLAGSPYAIKDYFDVCPDYATDPANRLREFQDMVDRIHAAGLKVIIDFVPNHVARSYNSTIRPDLNFGNQDDPTQYLASGNNFYYLTPEAKPFGKGPPLRLPTVDSDGRPTSPTCKVAKAPSDGLFEPEREHGRVTGSNLASWEPDYGSWYETVKLNYGYDFLGKKTRLYPHGDNPEIPVPDTWRKMDEIIAYWQGLGVDGFRADMAHMVPPEFWQWMIARARERNPGVFFVAEAYDTDPGKVPSADPLIAAVGGGNVMFDLLNSGFDAVYDDASYDKLKEVFEGGAWANDIDRIGLHPYVFDNSLRYAENHDEVRLASKSQWGGLGARVGRPVTAILFGMSRGPVMLYSGQEVGEPADGAEGFGDDDSRTSIFDYWSMPEFAKWVNGGKFDGGRLSDEQKSLREFYGRLVNLANEPAFRDGDFLPLNPANIDNPHFGRMKGETASGHYLYAFLRHDRASGQTFLVAVNIYPTEPMPDVRVALPENARSFVKAPARLTDRLGGGEAIPVTDPRMLSLGSLQPLTPYYFEIESAQ